MEYKNSTMMVLTNLIIFSDVSKKLNAENMNIHAQTKAKAMILGTFLSCTSKFSMLFKPFLSIVNWTKETSTMMQKIKNFVSLGIPCSLPSWTVSVIIWYIDVCSILRSEKCSKRVKRSIEIETRILTFLPTSWSEYSNSMTWEWNIERYLKAKNIKNQAKNILWMKFKQK